jgi:hypothetical protein
MSSKFVGAKKLFFGGFSKVFKGPQHEGKVATIGAVKPNVPVTKIEKAKSKLAIAKQKTKSSQARLDQTIFRIGQQKERLLGKKYKKGKELTKGERVNRRFGSPKPKTNIEKIKETFAPKKKLSPKQMKIAKLAGNPNKIDGADFKKLRGRG